MSNEDKTLDEINPAWLRRSVMVIISPFMISLMVCAMLLLYCVAIGFALSDPQNAKSKVFPFISDIFLDCIGTIKYWHVDIWNGNTIRSVTLENKQEKL